MDAMPTCASRNSSPYREDDVGFGDAYSWWASSSADISFPQDDCQSIDSTKSCMNSDSSMSKLSNDMP
jgi:hypothetical protein